MIKVYILTDNQGNVTRYSNIVGTGKEVIQDNPIIDMSKLIGYKVIVGEDNLYHLVYDEEKYNSYLKVEKEKAEYEQAVKEFEQLAKEQLLPNLSDEEAIEFKPLYPSFNVGVAYKIDDRITYKGKFYKVITTHTSQADWTPDVAVSLFKEVIV